MISIANKFKDFDLSLISKFRTELMGVSMLFVLFCHARLHGADFPSIILSILAFGDKGVDMFFLLSGVGIFYSLSSLRKSTGALFNWYKKRIFRIIIPYLIIETPFWLWYCIINNLTIGDFLSYISMLSFWTNHVGPWFIAFLIPLYIVSPLLYRLFSKSSIKSFVWCFVLIVFSLGISVLPFSNLQLGGVTDNIQFCIKRAPCYLIGMWVAPYIKEGFRVPYLKLLLLLVLYFIISYIPCPGGGCYYRGWLVACILIVVFALFFSWTSSHIHGINKPFAIIGVATLEIYLFYDVAVNLFCGFLSGTIYYFVTIAVAILLGVLFHDFYNRIILKK